MACPCLQGLGAFISTCNSHDRVFITKSQEILQQHDPDSKDVKLKNNIDRYVMQPRILEKWCLLDYVAKMGVSFSTDNGDNNHNEEQNCYDDNIEEEGHCSDDIFPINFRNNIKFEKEKKEQNIMVC